MRHGSAMAKANPYSVWVDGPVSNTRVCNNKGSTCKQRVYLIVTIICEYKILRFRDSDDFAGINFCDFTKSS